MFILTGLVFAVKIFPLSACDSNLNTEFTQPDALDSADVDIQKSTLFWRGTKMLKTGQHYGIVNVTHGTLIFDSNKNLIGGYITVDMKSIRVTDIPADDIVPIRNITNHLNIEFETSIYPESKFEITLVHYINDTTLNVLGQMKIRDITREITSSVRMKEKDNYIVYSTSLTLKRSLWGIGKKASWLEKKLVDDEFYLNIDLWISKTQQE